ncbi:hypothetical protein J7T55_006936 [Diaporthe amygdali]|uniref:uncharacterized protein n=1 Tax=Phomopsis amygdali TaxID=1214568 RepID=UPI0022FE08DC|nr:uncharacterized protein J7T55_006936 [Diaporthe amygdali]KAJ0107058.1 hypothetical protein J7T55_006936 [Diaporthe amygdali]
MRPAPHITPRSEIIPYDAPLRISLGFWESNHPGKKEESGGEGEKQKQSKQTRVPEGTGWREKQRKESGTTDGSSQAAAPFRQLIGAPNKPEATLPVGGALHRTRERKQRRGQPTGIGQAQELP